MTLGTSRRTVLRGIVGTIGSGVLAGCSGDSDDGDADDEDEAEEEADDGNGGADLGNSVDESVPQVMFEFEYDASAAGEDGNGVLTVTHAGGDAVLAAALLVRGDGIVNPGGVSPDVTSAGASWGQASGETSGERDAEPAVTAGDALTVGVRADYEVRLVWEHPERDTAQVLAEDAGPEA